VVPAPQLERVLRLEHVRVGVGCKTHTAAAAACETSHTWQADAGFDQSS
jgi:hypothetical protein